MKILYEIMFDVYMTYRKSSVHVAQCRLMLHVKISRMDAQLKHV
jgi:hypothetical protein